MLVGGKGEGVGCLGGKGGTGFLFESSICYMYIFWNFFILCCIDFSTNKSRQQKHQPFCIILIDLSSKGNFRHS